MKRIVDWFCKKTGLRNDFACWQEMPDPLSDVVSVTLVRQSDEGKLYEFSLTGEDARKWGYLVTHNMRTNRGVKELRWVRK